ncbi:8-amino-7-oxononanoate synthase, partial [Halorhodospira neutriphila]|nr:8-amino-7-oxononanoate synthase [Halorhodospira neutriphila]
MSDPAAQLDARLAPALEQRRAAGLMRRPEPLYGYDGAAATTAAGERVTVLCSNDYLGLAADPRVGRAMAA